MNANIQKIVDKISAKVATYTNPESLGTQELVEIIAIAVQDLYTQPDVYMASQNMTSVDFSNYINVERVFASNNDFTSIDVTPMVNLKYFDAGSSFVTNIDFSQNVLLEYLKFHSACETIDLSQNINLKTLIISSYDKSLTSLNISNSNLITYLELSYLNNLVNPLNISHLTNLEVLKIKESNSFASLNLSNNTKLKFVNIENNSLPETLVDDILIQIAAHATSENTLNGELTLYGNTPPSPAGLIAKSDLESLGWFVQVDS